MISARKDSPCDCSCNDTPPYESMSGGPNDGSESRCSISVATLKKLSARRKNPSLGFCTPLTMRRYWCSSECDVRVPKRKFFVPPSGLKPNATAMASSRVDFPEPFSPMKNVSLGCRSMESSVRTAARENG